MRSALFLGVLVCAGMTTSCMTTYDAYGNPVQSVDPGAAVAGAAAIGLLAYAAGNNNDDHYHHYRRGPYYGGGYGGGYCR